MNVFKFELGDKVTDTVTGFKGSVTSRCSSHLGLEHCVSALNKEGVLEDKA